MRCLPLLVRTVLGPLVALPISAEVHAETSTGHSSASAHFDVRVVVLPAIKVTNLQQPTDLLVTSEDVQRGYIDINSAGAPTLTSNSPFGYTVSVWFDERVVSHLSVQINENKIAVDAPGITIPVASSKLLRSPIRMAYRLFLSPTVRAGTYSWPVRLAFGLGF